MKPSRLYAVARSGHKGEQGPLLLCVVGRVRSHPHQMLVLVTLCTKCEEDVGMYDEYTQELRFSKSELVICMEAPEQGVDVVAWKEKCLPPRTPSISTTPFRLATLPLSGRARALSPADGAAYRQAYRQYARTLAQYTESAAFTKHATLQPWMFQESLSWIMAPPRLQPPAGAPGAAMEGHTQSFR